MNKQKGFVTPLLILALIIFILVFSYIFLVSPHKAIGNPVKPFKEGEYFLSEKITYLFSKPEVGDRIIFIPNNTGNEFLGIITKIEEDNNVKTHTVLSGGVRPWRITQDKIVGRIYFPFVSKEEILSSLPSQSPTPGLGSAADETANWKTYTNQEYWIQFKYPSNLSFEEFPTTLQTRKFLTIMIDRYGDNILSMHIEGIPIGNPEQDRDYVYLNLTPKERIINGYKWKEYLVKPEDYPKGAGLVPQWPNLHLDAEYGGFVYIISTFKKTSFNERQEQILSTFKFTQ